MDYNTWSNRLLANRRFSLHLIRRFYFLHIMTVTSPVNSTKIIDRRWRHRSIVFVILTGDVITATSRCTFSGKQSIIMTRKQTANFIWSCDNINLCWRPPSEFITAKSRNGNIRLSCYSWSISSWELYFACHLLVSLCVSYCRSCHRGPV
jgi:hypothetical protein